MNADHSKLKHGELTQGVIGIFFDVYNELGHGFLESIYKSAMTMALAQAGMQVEQELPIPVRFRGTVIGDFRADLLVNRTILLELKAAKALERAHEAQLLNYLRATEVELGLLLNFGSRPEFRRLLLTNDQKTIRGNPCASVAKGSSA